MKQHIEIFLEKLTDYPVLLDEFIKRYPEIFTIAFINSHIKEISVIKINGVM